jgi:hypothetical protein
MITQHIVFVFLGRIKSSSKPSAPPKFLMLGFRDLLQHFPPIRYLPASHGSLSIDWWVVFKAFEPQLTSEVLEVLRDCGFRGSQKESHF